MCLGPVSLFVSSMTRSLAFPCRVSFKRTKDKPVFFVYSCLTQHFIISLFHYFFFFRGINALVYSSTANVGRGEMRAILTPDMAILMNAFAPVNSRPTP